MKEALSMHIEDSISKLFRDMSDFPFLKPHSSFLPLGDKFIEILFDILEDKVGLIDDSDNFLHSDNISMIHFP